MDRCNPAALSGGTCMASEAFCRRRDLGIAFLAIFLIPRYSSRLANVFGSTIEEVDPDGTFMFSMFHHSFQLLLTIALILVFFNDGLQNWGFNFRNAGLSLKIFGWFCLIYLVPVFLYNVLPSLLSGTPPDLGYPLTTKNMAGVLGFMFLWTGTCEEPLFRGFVMTLLARSWTGTIGLGKLTLPVSGIWATAFFMFDQMNITMNPFTVEYSFMQQVWQLGLGLYYAVVFSRTGSLLAPILSHGYSNGIIFVAFYTLAAVM